MVCRFGAQAVMGLLSLWKPPPQTKVPSSLYQYNTLFGTVFLSATYRTTIKSENTHSLTDCVTNLHTCRHVFYGM